MKKPSTVKPHCDLLSPVINGIMQHTIAAVKESGEKNHPTLWWEMDITCSSADGYNLEAGQGSSENVFQGSQIPVMALVKGLGRYECQTVSDWQASGPLTWTTGCRGFWGGSSTSSSSRSVVATKLNPRNSWWAPALGGTPGESRGNIFNLNHDEIYTPKLPVSISFNESNIN